MPVCPTCGTDNAVGALMCGRCGTRLQGEEARGVSSSASIAERLLDRAFRLSDEGRLDDAIAAAEQAVAANSQSTSAHSLLGILYERAGQRQKAISQYEQALTLSPRSSADREALRQLMARPGARRRGKPSPTRVAVFGAFVAACAFLVAGIGMVVRTGPSGRPILAGAEPGAAPVAAFPTPPSLSQASSVVAGPSVPAAAPRMPAPTPAAPSAPLPAPVAQTTLRPPMAAQSPAPAPQSTPLRFPVGPEAAPISQPQPPLTLARPAAPISVPSVPTVASEQVARTYYFDRDYSKAAATYEKYLGTHIDSAAYVHEELAWCYYRMSRDQDAVREYRRALARYRQEASDPDRRDEALHGIRSCEAALAALQGT